MEVNNGNFRRTLLVMRRFVNERERLDGLFPIIENITDPFVDQPGLTIQDFTLLTDEEYLFRLNLFYSYLEFKYSFFNRFAYTNLEDPEESPFGTDTDSCPIDNSVTNRVYLDFDLVIFEGENREAELWIDLKLFNGVPYVNEESFMAEVLLKESYSIGYAEWTSIQGQMFEIEFPLGVSRVQILDRFRFDGIEGVDIEFKNIYAKLIGADIDHISIGKNHTVYTESSAPFFLMNLITNIGTSAQAEPPVEGLESVLNRGEGMADPANLIFTFKSNENTRPVLIYPASYPVLSSIEFIQEGGMNILSAGAFSSTELILNYKGEDVLFRVYFAKNMIVYPKKIDYKFIL